MKGLYQIFDFIRLLPIGGPGVCHIAITNACNARCDFCNYAVHKSYVKEKLWVDPDEFQSAMDVLHDRGIRYVTLVGGEPLLHPQLLRLVSLAAGRGLRPSLVTNGSRLSPEMVLKLDAAGLKTLFISIDAASDVRHESHRGLPGVCRRIRQANRTCSPLRMATVASVTVNKLIDDFPALLNYLADLGFDTVNFAYPKTRLHSAALSFSHESGLIAYDPVEMTQALDTIRNLKTGRRILNSRESLMEIKNFVQAKEQRYPCYGGYKYFFLDCRLNIYRCDFWPEPIGSVHEFRSRPFVRDVCTRCISGCYRDASVLMHAGVSLADALADLREGRWRSAVRHLAKPTNLRSIKTLLQDWSTLRTLAAGDAAKGCMPASERN